MHGYGAMPMGMDGVRWDGMGDGGSRKAWIMSACSRLLNTCDS